MRVQRVRGSRPAFEWLQETFGAELCRVFGHGRPMLYDVHYEVRQTVLIGSVDVLTPTATRRIDRAVVCGRCGRRVGD